MKKLIAFLFLAGAVFGFGLTVTAGGPYNPGATVNYNVTLNESVSGVQVNASITNSTGSVVDTGSTTTDGSGVAAFSYALPTAAGSGSWTITASATNSSNATAAFTVNALVASSGSVSVNATSFNPGDSVLVTFASVLTQIGTGYTGSATAYLYYDAVQQNSATVMITDGAGNTTFTLPANATNMSWKASASFNSTGQNFTVNRLFANPGVSAASLSVEKGNTTLLNVTVTNNANFNDAFTISASVPTNITANSSLTSAIGSSASTTVAISLLASGTAAAGTSQVNVTVASAANASYNATTSVTLTVNPSHSFNISLNGTSATGTPGGSAVSFLLNITNLGDASEIYNIACSSSLNWTCTPSSTSATVGAGAYTSPAITLSASVSQNAAQGTISAFTVNVTSATYGSTYLNQTAFNVTAGASVGGSLSFFGTDASNTYWVKASTNRAFVLAVNNTGNTNAYYNVTITAGSWNLSASGSCGSATINASNSSTLACPLISGLNYTNVTVTIAPPANAAPCSSTSIAFSLSNGTTATPYTITAKTPCFTTASALSFNPTTGILIVQVTAVLREGVSLDALNISSLTYSILSPAGAVLNTSSATPGTAYTLNYSSTTTYPSNGNYFLSIAVSDNSSANYSSGNLTYRFRLVRSVTVAGTTSVSTVAGAAFSIALTSKYDSGDDTGSAPSISGLCGVASGTSTYTYACTAPSVSTSITATSPAITSCAYGINVTCTLTSSLSYVLPITVTIGTLQQQQQQGGGGGGGANATANVTANLTAGASQSVNISMPATANITGAGNLTITVSNLANVTQLVNVSIDEQGDYSHFMLNVSAPASIGAGANATFAVNITPYKYAKPGTYTVTVDVLGQKKNYTVTVPSPAYAPDTVNVNRYVETSKNKSSSVVYLEVVNRKFEAANVTIRETIPKALANSTAGITFLTPYTTVVEDDPVVEWTLSLAPGETAEIRYTVKTDALNASFSEPTVTETLPPVVAPPAVEVVQQSDNTWALVLIGIVVIAGAVFAYLYFVERPLLYRILAEARMKFEDATRWLKK